MNAKSERASLPDRVEAAAKARHEAQFPNTPWRVMSEPTKSHDRELMAAALAAADACKAERNPNRQLPHKFPPNAPDEVIAWRCAACGEWSDIHGEFPAPCPIDWRSAVSSEDVHREAAE